MENEIWKTVEPNIWKPKEKGDFIEGNLLTKDIRDFDGEISSKYKISTKAGVILVWGSTILDDRLELVEIGQEIRITFQGIKELSKKKTLKLYTVDVKVVE